MDTVIRGPNLPPRVVGALHGHFNIAFHNCRFNDALTRFNAIHLVLWGIPPKEIPHFDLPVNGRSYTVVCPVVSDWTFFEHYLRESRRLVAEFRTKNVTLRASIELNFPMAPSKKKSQLQSVPIKDEFQDVHGTVDVALWLDYHRSQSAFERNKRRRVTADEQQGIKFESISDVFDVLDQRMTEKGLRLIDVFRSCNELNGPVADVSSMINRFVDSGLSMTYRHQFWALIDWTGRTIFTFTEFKQRFQNARRAVSTVKTGIKLEICIREKFLSVYKAVTRNGTLLTKLYEEMDVKTLMMHVTKIVPEMESFDLCVFLTMLFLELTEQVTWTLEEIRIAFKIGTEPNQQKTQAVSQLELGKEEKPSDEKETNSDLAKESTVISTVSAPTQPKAEVERSQNTESETNIPVNKDTSIEKKSGDISSVKNDAISRYPSQKLDLDDTNSIHPQQVVKRMGRELLQSVISKCRGLIDRMSCTAEALTTINTDMNHMATPLLTVGCGDPSVMHITPELSFKQRYAKAGLPDDPDMLIQDILFDLEYIRGATIPSSLHTDNTVARSCKTESTRTLESAKGVLNKGEDLDKNLFGVELMIHSVSARGQYELFSAVVRTTGFISEVESALLASNHSLLIPFTATGKCSIFIEIWQCLNYNGDKTKKGALIGVAQICIDTTTPNCHLNHCHVPILDLCKSSRRGVVEVSLVRQSIKRDSAPATRGGIKLQNTTQPSVTVNNKLNTHQVIEPSQQMHQHSEQLHGKQTENETENVLYPTGVPTSVLPSIQGDGVTVRVHDVRLETIPNEYFVTCCLEGLPHIVYKSEIVHSTVLNSRLLFEEARFPVPDIERDTWLERTIIFKVISPSEPSGVEETVGEMQLDLSCLARFGRICGPMGLMNAEFKRIGVIEIDISLLSFQSMHQSNRISDTQLNPVQSVPPVLQENAAMNSTIPLQTCSDDENYVVIASMDGGEISSNSDDIDELCCMFAHSANTTVRTNIRQQPSIENTLHPFHCDDDFLLDFSRQRQFTTETVPQALGHEDYGPDLDLLQRSSSIDEFLPDEDGIHISRVTSDMLTKEDSNKWTFKTTLPLSPSSSPIQFSDTFAAAQTSSSTFHADSTSQQTLDDGLSSDIACKRRNEADSQDEQESNASVDIDELLQKYQIERRPGWWKSLVETDGDDFATGS